MSVDVSSLGGGGKGQSQDFELNLASIIDCFTVLITFLLASSAFLSIGILDAGVAAGTPAPEVTTPPPVQISVELLENSAATLKITGKTDRQVRFEKKDGGRDLEGLAKELAQIRAHYPTVEALTLSASDAVEYKDVILVMDSIRKTVPVVLLGGF